MAVKKKAGELMWAKECVHPVTNKPCGGRKMSTRDKKLFTRVGKRRAGVTPTMVKEAYGLKKVSAKRKTTKRKTPSAKRKTTKGKAAKRKPAATGRRTKKAAAAAPHGRQLTAHGVPKGAGRFVIINGSGQYMGSGKLLTAARKKLASLQVKHPRMKLTLLDTKG